MKGLDKLTNVRLAEILSQNDIVATEKITDALYSTDRSGMSFAQIILEAGYVPEWDLARIVCDHFNLPFLPASAYQVSREALKLIPRDIIVDHAIVPVEVLDGLLTVSMAVFTPFEILDQIQKTSKLEIFPCVGTLSDNKKVLLEAIPEAAGQLSQRKKAAGKSTAGSSGGSGWTSLFDAGDQAVRKELGPSEHPVRSSGSSKVSSVFDAGDEAVRKDLGSSTRK